MLLPLYSGFRLFEIEGRSMVGFYLPTFFMANLVLSDWLEFFILCYLQNLIAYKFIDL